MDAESFLAVLSTLPEPAIAIPPSGDGFLMNPAMESALSGNHPEGGLKLSPASPAPLVWCEGSFGRAVIGGGALIPSRLPDASLIGVWGADKAAGFTFAVYGRDNTAAREKLEILNSLRMAAGPSPVESGGTAGISLKDALEHVLPSGSGALLELNLDDAANIYCAPLAITISQMLTVAVLRELLEITATGHKIAVSFIPPATWAARGRFFLVLSTIVDELWRKTASMKIHAAYLRVVERNRAFCSLMEIKSPEPEFSVKKSSVDVRLEIDSALHPSRFQRSRAVANPFGLTGREIEITEMLRSGLDDVKIGEALGISVSTVKQHFKAIFRKTGARGKLELIFKLRGQP